MTLALCAGPALHAQNAATEERLNRLSGQIDGLIEGQQVLKKQIDELAKELDAVREQATRPTGNYASQDDLKRLADALKEVDQKRMEDNETIRKDLLNLGKKVSLPPPHATRISSSTPPTSGPDKTPSRGYEYVVQKGDTLSVIIQAYREKGVKVTLDGILKANPGLKPERMQVGQKIFIPDPKA